MKTIGTSIRLSIALFFTLPTVALAGAVLNYHGRILDNTDRPLEAPAVNFRIRIYSPNPTKCLLYEETRTLNMRNSQGVFVIPIGDGHGTRTDADPGITMEDVFANNGKTISSLVCNSTSSYTSQALDQRQMTVSFDDNTGYGWDNLPPMDISYVPFAVHAYDAQNIGGAPASSVLRVSSGSASPLSPANFSELLNLINGSTLQYEKVGILGGQSLPALGNGQVLGWNAGSWTAVTPMTSFTEADPNVKSFAKSDLPNCGANSFLKNDGAGNFSCAAVSGATGGTVTSVAAGAGLLNQTNPGNPITSTGTLAIDVGTGIGQIVQLDGTARLPAVDGSQLTNVTASGLSNTASINTSGNITTTGNIQATQNITSRRLVLFDHSGAGPDSVSLQAPADMAGAGGASYSLTFPEKKGATGQVLAAKDGNGALEWISPSSGSVTSVTASAPLSSSAGSTPNITLSKASAAQDGYLSKEDWDAFNNKAAYGNYITALSGDVTAAGPGSAVTTIANNAITSAKILNGTIVGADLDFTGVNTATSNFVMKDNTGKFSDFACSTTGHVPTWTVAGFVCQAPSITEADPKIGANTLNMLSKWDGSRMIASTVYENSGSVGIGTSSPAAGLEVNTTGASSSILVPRDTTGNRPSSPVNGMIRYNTTTSSFEGYAGNAWSSLGDSSVASTQGVSFHVHKNGVNQTVTSGVYVKLTWPTEVFDTNNNFANSRFTPTVAGKYLINLGVVCAGATHCYGAIYKNGAMWVNSGGPVYSQVNIVIDMNGTTDYLEAYAQNSGGTSFWADSNYTYFSGSLLSSATVASGGSGTANYVPLWTSGTALGNSPIAASGSNVGIGTTSPSTALDINGTAKANSFNMGYQRVSVNCGAVSANTFCQATCPGTKKILTGGCASSGAMFDYNHPSTDSVWACRSPFSTSSMWAYAVCANIE